MKERRMILLNGVRYHADRPKDCKNCDFFKNKKTGCVLKDCYYLAEYQMSEQEKKCEKCNYAKARPCVSKCCYKDLELMLRNMQAAKDKERKGNE